MFTMTDDTDDSGGVIFEGPFDPDAQATVTDFIDYTEYLPSDLIRSLTLIRGLDETYLDATQKVHELTKVYGQLPELPAESRPNAQELREQISVELNRAINAREASYAEACRIYDVVDRHYDRLGNIKRKLELLPRPPSRDATPAAKRQRGGRKTDEIATRITLRVDGQVPDKVGLPKSRSRRSMITGLNPDSPIASTEQSDNETPKVRSRRGAVAVPDDEALQLKKNKKRGRQQRPSGTGTNVRSVAGISTSNALALLKPPPEDAKIGSEDLPWLRLTDWEMTKLRKRMKKNAVWQPSEVMINRELARNGRGWEGYRAAKAQAEAAGEELIDCDDIENTYVPGKLIRKAEATADMSAVEEIKTSNRGMLLNEAKRLKRENIAREQEAASAAAAAAAAAQAEMAAKRLGDIGSTFKSLFSTPGDLHGAVAAATDSPKPNGTASTPSGKGKSRPSRKRKAEESPSAERLTIDATLDSTNQPPSSKPPSKRRNVSAAPAESSQVTSNTSPATIAQAETAKSKALKTFSSSPPPTRARSTASSRASLSRGHAVINQKTTATPTPPTTRPPSRRRSGATSAEPGAATNAAVAGITRDHLRRKSTTPALKTPAPDSSAAAVAGTSARRKKRPAPGPVSSSLEGGATVSHGKRKSKPKKRAPGKETIKGEDYRIDEDGVLEKIDPNEPRYCLCKDVSFGTMINCENPDCEGEWFHLDCIGLSEPPSRRAKWFCPECRVKLKKAPDGIERVGGRR